jgi:hypothetical protein
VTRRLVGCHWKRPARCVGLEDERVAGRVCGQPRPVAEDVRAWTCVPSKGDRSGAANACLATRRSSPGQGGLAGLVSAVTSPSSASPSTPGLWLGAGRRDAARERRGGLRFRHLSRHAAAPVPSASGRCYLRSGRCYLRSGRCYLRPGHCYLRFRHRSPQVGGLSRDTGSAARRLKRARRRLKMVAWTVAG